MTLKEYSLKQANKLKEKPFKSTIIEVVNNINSQTVDGNPITNSQIEQILNYLSEELEDLSILNESFDNTETLTLMDQVRQLIAQTNKNK